MTQSRLASAIGLSEAMVSKVLKGTQPFSLATAFEVSLLTGIPVERLVAPGRARRILELYVNRLRSTGEIAKDLSDVA